MENPRILDHSLSSTAVIIMGISGIVAQVLLLREFLVLFWGNELTIGLILANWIILESIGSYLSAKFLTKQKNAVLCFIIVQIIFAIALPATIYYIRDFRMVFAIQPGVVIDLGRVIIGTIILLVPVSITHGALFSLGVRVVTQSRENIPNPGGSTYLLEMIGTIIGSILVTFIMIPSFETWQSIVFISVINIIICLSLILAFMKLRNLFPKVVFIISVVLTLLFLIFYVGSLFKQIDEISIARQYPHNEILAVRNTDYGNIVVGHSDGQYTFFYDGLPYITSPDPDLTYIEDFAHLPLLAHNDPQDILIIGQGAGGIITEILKHQPRQITYTELDPELIEMLKQYGTPMIQAELSDDRVNIVNDDGRHYLERTREQYDVVIIGMTEVSDLQTNRFFTEEFFHIVKSRLSEKGIFVLGSVGSLSYLTAEMLSINEVLLNTIKAVFDDLKVIPGDQVNIFLASKSEVDLDKQLYADRYVSRALSTAMISEQYLNYRLHERWRNWFWNQMSMDSEQVNSDMKPLLMYSYLRLWNVKYSPETLFIIDNQNWVYFALGILIMVLFILNWRNKQIGITVSASIMTTGFAAMIFDLLVIYFFQIVYGYVYSWIGLIFASFMVGATVGAFGSIKYNAHSNITKVFLISEIVIVIFCFLLIIIYQYIIEYRLLLSVFIKPITMLLAFSSGFLIGRQFPLANNILKSANHDVSYNAGKLYAFDLLGGWIGGVLSAIVLMPMFGIINTLILVGTVKIISALVFAINMKHIHKKIHMQL